MDSGRPTTRSQTHSIQQINNYHKDILPFPDGTPTHGIELALTALSAYTDEHDVLGEVDNLVTTLLFATKKGKTRQLAYRPAQFPARSDVFGSLTTAAKKRFHWISKHILSSCDRVEWRKMLDSNMEGLQSFVSDEVLAVLRSDAFKRYLVLKLSGINADFVRTMLRYMLFRSSTRVGLRKVWFPQEDKPQGAIIALEAIPPDTILWELNAILSKNPVTDRAISVIKPHSSQGRYLSESSYEPRMMAGPARFANHHCNANSVVSDSFDVTSSNMTFI
jgi:hypothetical protein